MALRDSRELKEPKIRNEIIRKIRLKERLNSSQNKDNPEVTSVIWKKSGGISLKRRLSAKCKTPVPKDSTTAHFESTKFSEIDKFRPASTLGIRGRRWSRPQSPFTRQTMYNMGYSGVSMKSAIDFTKQIPRKQFIDPKNGPNQHRFQLLKTPKVLSSYHEPHPPQFKLSNGRLLLSKKDVYLPDYDVNMDSIGKPLGQGVPLFEKFIKRKDPAIEKTFSVPECYPLSQIEKGEKHLSNFTEKKIIPMQKQLPRDNRMYNINEGFNLKPKKDTLTSNQRLDSALSFYDSQQEPRVKSRASANQITHQAGVERRLSAKRRYSLTCKGEKGGRRSPLSFKILDNSLHQEWEQLQKLTENRKRLKLSQIEL